MSHPRKCPKCEGQVIGVEYAYGDKYRYDGVSEYACTNTLADKPTCDWRIGRWCEQELTGGMVEPPFCDGTGHPRVFTIEQPNETESNRAVQAEEE